MKRHQETLRTLGEWDAFLMRESGLPGPRGNIELAQAVAEEGDEDLFRHYLTFGPASAPANSPREFLAFCGVLGLGRLVAEGRRAWTPPGWHAGERRFSSILQQARNLLQDEQSASLRPPPRRSSAPSYSRWRALARPAHLRCHPRYAANGRGSWARQSQPLSRPSSLRTC